MELESEVKKTSEKVEVLDIEQERITHSIWLERNSFRIALISTFTALAIVLGYLLAYIPNIELFTLTIFLSGFILGKRDGMMIGLLSSFIFCYFNPFGSSPLPLLAFQLFHYSITGFLGALTSDLLQRKKSFKPSEDLYKFSIVALLGIIGALITTNFQIFSSIIHVLTFLGSLDKFLPYFLTGSIFTAIHIIGNTLGFIFILPGLIQLIRKMLY
ncbi:MAG: ECF transporter S component [Promethearchaeota archaeon]|nr:MAG: ECF transporter S component [Candidatus Lokiarchaeota archaeon]